MPSLASVVIGFTAIGVLAMLVALVWAERRSTAREVELQRTLLAREKAETAALVRANRRYLGGGKFGGR